MRFILFARPLALTAVGAAFVLAGCAPTADVAAPRGPVDPTVVDGTAGPDYGFGTYDADGDGFVSDAEFGVGFAATPYYGSYDVDGDGVLDRDEFTAGTATYGYDYDAFDADRDGFVTDAEYNVGVYGAFDTNRDGVLDRNEFDAGLGTYRF